MGILKPTKPMKLPLADSSTGPDPRLQQAKARYAPILDDGAMRLSTLMVKLGSP